MGAAMILWLMVVFMAGLSLNTIASAGTGATSDDGRRVILNDDGTWELLSDTTFAGGVDAAVLNPLKDVLTIETIFSQTLWRMVFSLGSEDPKYFPVSAARVPEIVRAWLNSPPSEVAEKDARLQYERELIEIHVDKVEGLFQNLRLMGGELGEFFITRNDAGPVSVPLHFVEWQGESAVLTTGVAYRQIFNTQRTTSKERAARVLEAVSVPSLKAYTRLSFGNIVRHFAIAVTYGSSDFGDDSILNKQAETVAVIVDQESCQRFFDGEITQEELVQGGTVFLADRNAAGSIKRVNVEIR